MLPMARFRSTPAQEFARVNRLFGRRRNRIIAVAVLVPVLVAVGFGLYLASLAGELPLQADPTRIAITPFADIPGFGAPTEAPSSATPVAAVRR